MRKNEEYDVNRREYDEKVEEIRQKKRKLRDIQEPELVKKLNKDLKREQRSEKRSDYNNLEIYIIINNKSHLIIFDKTFFLLILYFLINIDNISILLYTTV